MAPTVLGSVAVGSCRLDNAHELRCPPPEHPDAFAQVMPWTSTLHHWASHPRPHPSCNMPPGCSSTLFLFPLKPSRCASYRHTMPIPPMREHRMRPQPTGLRCKTPAPPMREHLMRLSPLAIGSNLPVPPLRERSKPLHRTVRGLRMSVLSRRESNLLIAMLIAQDTSLSRTCALVLLMSRLAQPTLDGQVPLDDSRSDLMHCQCRLSVLQWNPGPARENPTQVLLAACGHFHAVILPETGNYVPHISELFHTNTEPSPKRPQTKTHALMAAFQSPDTNTLFTSTPRLRAQLVLPQTTRSQQMNKLALLLKPLGPALGTNTTQERLVFSTQKHLHKQFLESHATSTISRAVLISQSAPHIGAHLLQPNSEAHEDEDRCFRVCMARKLMLPHPAAPRPFRCFCGVPQQRRSGQICGKRVDVQQHNC